MWYFDAMTQNYTVDEVAASLRVTRRTVYRWIESGKLPTVKAGKRHLITDADVRAFLSGGGSAEVGTAPLVNPATAPAPVAPVAPPASQLAIPGTTAVQSAKPAPLAPLRPNVSSGAAKKKPRRR